MAWVDRIYGSMPICKRIWGLMESPLLERLKGVHQNGPSYLIDPRQNTSRFEHSVGCMVLVAKLGGEESMQVGALLHDVPHTAFSHTMDHAFGLKGHSFHNLVRNQFLQTPQAQSTLNLYGVTHSELNGYTHPLIKTADRLDYTMRDLLRVDRIDPSECSSVLKDLTIGQDDIQCKSIQSARWIFQKSIEASRNLYFSPQFEAANLVMSTIVKKLVDRGDLKTEDIFSTDEEVLALIRNSPFRKQLEAINPSLAFSISDEPTPYPIYRRLRYIDPMIANEGKLTDICSLSKEVLEEYLSTVPTLVFYRIPTLEQL